MREECSGSEVATFETVVSQPLAITAREDRFQGTITILLAKFVPATVILAARRNVIFSVYCVYFKYYAIRSRPVDSFSSVVKVFLNPDSLVSKLFILVFFKFSRGRLSGG